MGSEMCIRDRLSSACKDSPRDSQDGTSVPPSQLAARPSNARLPPLAIPGSPAAAAERTGIYQPTALYQPCAAGAPEGVGGTPILTQGWGWQRLQQQRAASTALGKAAREVKIVAMLGGADP